MHHNFSSISSGHSNIMEALIPEIGKLLDYVSATQLVTVSQI